MAHDFSVLRQLNGLRGVYGKPITGLAPNPTPPAGGNQFLIKQGNNIHIFCCAPQRLSHVMQSTAENIPTVACKAATFSPDGHYVLAASEGIGVNIWDAVHGQRLKTVSIVTKCALCQNSCVGLILVQSISWTLAF